MKIFFTLFGNYWTQCLMRYMPYLPYKNNVHMYTVSRKTVNPYTMCDGNTKSECILIKLCALVFECICERTTKFREKILFDSGVINVQIPMTN